MTIPTILPRLLLTTVASIIAPYSVKALGKEGENLSLLRWSPNCDPLVLLGLCWLEHEIRREAIFVAFHRLIEDLCRHSVKLREIRIQHYLVSADR